MLCLRQHLQNYPGRLQPGKLIFVYTVDIINYSISDVANGMRVVSDGDRGASTARAE